VIVSRVTPSLIAQRTLRDINAQLGRIALMQERLSTGYRVNRPSDDPLDARRAVNVRVLLQKNEQFISNIDDLQPQYSDAESAMDGMVSIFQRAQELAVQSANGTNGQQQFDAIALEINGLLESAVTAANTRTNGRSIFAGTRTMADAFTATRDANGDITAVAYNGNDEVTNIDIADGSQIAANIPGSDAFQDTIDVFNVLIGLRDDLRAGNQTNVQNTRLTEIQNGIDQSLGVLARIGAASNRLERTTNALQDGSVQLKGLLSDKIDADYADTVLNLNVAQNAYQAALSAAARVLNVSLLDFVS
jgi:flagellar hook-associated protein 3 FlgL